MLQSYPQMYDVAFNFTVKNPQLWWTWNLGTPYLYKYKIVITQEGISSSDVVALDTRSTRVGIRTIRWI